MTQELHISLPSEMAELVRAKVKAGEYATESEVIHDGLSALLDRDTAVDRWLHEQVASTYDAMQAEPRRAISLADVRNALEDESRRTPDVG